MAETDTAYIALGSNLGDRRGSLEQALALLRLNPGIVVQTVSSFHETVPVGGPPGQGKYLNAVAELRTSLGAEKLLRILLAVESQMGRVRSERDAPRTVDLDLLLYGMEVRHQSDGALILPHPRMHERPFVLEPLAEIAPVAVHPLLQSTVKDLLSRCKDAVATKPFARELVGQTAMVTGSSSGIGRAIARALSFAGANLIVHGRCPERAESVARECRSGQSEAKVLIADLSKEDACEKLVADAWTLFGNIDIWINNAGADTLTGEAARWLFERKLEELWAVDVRATLLLSRGVGERMKQRRRGVILTVGWDQAETGMEGESGQLFGATKGAVMAFTRSLALSLAPEVRVNCLAPGWIRTAWGESASAAWQSRVVRETPLHRWGTAEDVAQMALWLVSPAAEYITGQILRVNGGAVRS